MEETKVKKAKAPAKPRKTAAPKATPIAIEAPARSNGAVSASNVKEFKPSHEQVAQLAHRYWSERGHQHGHHVEDWLRAEHELVRGKAS
jgi:hypothetical protein